MRRLLLCAGLAFASFTGTAVVAAVAAEHSTAFDAKIGELCRRHNVPERLVHRVIMRESRYAPRAVSRGNFGLMQIRLGTARSMGYAGGAEGLLDGNTNLTYAVPYLANAYAVAGGDEDRAVRLYASGFYYVAKRQGSLARRQRGTDGRLAAAPAPVSVAFAPVAYAPTSPNPLAALFGAATPVAESAPLDMVARADDSGIEGDADTVPLPPRRPRAFSTRSFLRLVARASDAEALGTLRADASE